ncbi:hypothetical protein T4B_3021 [Trichinella pseudospiralis]|uniref:Uncharacterized protein n=2 Tax=Trichinella pseudospiralis TaxID=6337 RepID=A0A0V1IEL6_TRIPS|nr:hypothetical protein T4A_14492 [Trichinella pseudospiralis]KRY91628.1 hypothetical protein T4D_5788 [Trichinella pseudospiralis]KRZ21228.1 hypothetical protein T4B_3021 [Trichinella pseudospiralis]KRZ45045.1 hypothetical protein T4C_6419 [Trichinella pseudospiralis]
MLSFSSLFIICHRFTCSVYEARCLRRQASQSTSQPARQTDKPRAIEVVKFCLLARFETGESIFQNRHAASGASRVGRGSGKIERKHKS